MKPHYAFCTIIARNYLASARTLCASLRSLHPEVPIYVLFIDGFDGSLDAAGEPFEPISLGGLKLDNLKQLAFQYDVVELATVVKPKFLLYLMDRLSLSKLIYLDPDIFVFNPLNDVFVLLDDSNLVLTPHLDCDYPDDGCCPNTLTILTHGLYNLGFLALRNSPETLRFLQWWDTKIKDNCTRDYTTAHYVDQRVMDLVPLLFSGVYLERHPGYNAAYWNIHTRLIHFRDGTWLCNDRPLFFFHFSAFDPNKPRSLSRDISRPIPEPTEGLFKLLAVYQEMLLKNGFATTRNVDYGHSRFTNGDLIEYAARSFFRNSPLLKECEEDPFGAQRLLAYNRIERVKRRHPHNGRILSRIAQKLWVFIHTGRLWLAAPRQPS